MDNNLIPNHSMHQERGSDKYLPYSLTRSEFLLAGSWLEHQRDTKLFFSFKQALCELLLTDDLTSLDHLQADQKDAYRFWRHAIALTQGDVPLVSLRVLRPSADFDEPAGVYLFSTIDLIDIERATGWKLPPAKGGHYAVLLATLGEDGYSVTPTPTLEQLRTSARAHHLEMNLQLDICCYQTAFKGHYLGDDTLSAGYEKREFVHLNYYQTYLEAAVELICTPPRLFDQECQRPDNDNRMYDFGYLNPIKLNAPELSICTLTLDDSSDGAPCAGIYLFSDTDIEDVEQATGLNLNNGFDYDAGAPMLMLAEFRYYRGLSLVAAEDLHKIIRQTTDMKQSGVLPQGYQVSLEFDSLPHNMWTSKMAVTSNYYCHDLATALLQLLSTELFLMDNVPGELSCYHLKNASIQNGAAFTVASLVMEPDPYRLGDRVISLKIPDGAARHFADLDLATTRTKSPLLWPRMQAYQLHIPLVVIGEDRKVKLIDESLMGIKVAAAQQRNGNYLKEAILKNEGPRLSRGEGEFPYWLEIEWSIGNIGMPATVLSELIGFANPEMAYRSLLKIPAVVSPADPNSPAATLSKATLLSSDMSMIAHRFVENDQESREVTLFLCHNLGHQDASRLIAYHPIKGFEQVERSSPAHLVTFRQVNDQAGVQAKRPRYFGYRDDGSGQRPRH